MKKYDLTSLISVYLADPQRSQWDRCLSSVLIRSSIGAGFGIIFSVLLFRRRAWPAFVGFGFGAGRAWEECDNVRALLRFWHVSFADVKKSFRNAAIPHRDGLRVIRP